ncbi:hypothetical protein [Paractinoplanes atraurantiacus]|uniref:hypothetical protein n=1 Tax=Paractinoplanes atraurantiacus TaxID=1036182 RepID=UPI0015CF6EB6
MAKNRRNAPSKPWCGDMQYPGLVVVGLQVHRHRTAGGDRRVEYSPIQSGLVANGEKVGVAEGDGVPGNALPHRAQQRATCLFDLGVDQALLPVRLNLAAQPCRPIPNLGRVENHYADVVVCERHMRTAGHPVGWCVGEAEPNLSGFLDRCRFCDRAGDERRVAARVEGWPGSC